MDLTRRMLYPLLASMLPRAWNCANHPLAKLYTRMLRSHSRHRPPTDNRLVLSGDCGGTNTRLRLFRIAKGAKRCQPGEDPSGVLVYHATYKNAEYASFEALCSTFLEEAQAANDNVEPRPAAVCLACAGVVVENAVAFTNLNFRGWRIDGHALARYFDFYRVRIINDFVAQGLGCLSLRRSELFKLGGGEPEPNAPKAMLGAGTGLGQCFLTADSRGFYTAWPSEGGHTEWSPRNELMLDLLGYLRQLYSSSSDEELLDGSRPKRVSVERVVSGLGLSNLYAFLREHWAFIEYVRPEFDAEYLALPRQKHGYLITRGAGEGDVLCRKAIQIFSECFGSEAGVVALKFLPYGGLYLSGGIAAKHPEWLQTSIFTDAFKDKGRLSPLLDRIPLYVVLVEDTGERGALYAAVHMLLDITEGSQDNEDA